MMIKRYFLLSVLLLAPILAVPASVLAVDVIPGRVCNKDKGERDASPRDSTLCTDNRTTTNNPNNNPLFGPEGVLTGIISLLSVIVGIAAVIMIILGGLKFITSGNNAQDVATARERVIYALVALVIAALAQVIVRFVLRDDIF